MNDRTDVASLLRDLRISRSDLEMLVDDNGGDDAAPGPGQRLVALARALMEHCYE
jgi:hypothetical protein